MTEHLILICNQLLIFTTELFHLLFLMTLSPDSLTEKYELVVGLEVHVQLSTSSKIFSSDSAGFGG